MKSSPLRPDGEREMNDSRRDILDLIKNAVKQKNIYWTYHVFMRMRDRSISRQSIIGSTDTFEIIESYPDDKYMPSYLVRAECDSGIIHVFFALDPTDGFVRIVTAYRPDDSLWSGNGKQRL